MQNFSTDKTVRKDTIQDLKDFTQQFLTTQVEKGEQLVSIMPALEKALNLLVDDIVELSTENDALKSKKVSYDKKWFQESKHKKLKQIDDEKKGKFNYV